MNKIWTGLAFITGLSIGSIITWRLCKDTYANLAQEEIDSVKEEFSKHLQKITGNDEQNINDDASISANEENDDIIEKRNYRNYSTTIDKVDDTSDKQIDREDYAPCVISPEEFGEIEEYDQISLTYYDDKILADDNDEMVENIDDTVGFDSLNTFGEYEDDSVYVRNDKLKAYYEILYDRRKYMDVLKGMPPRMGS